MAGRIGFELDFDRQGGARRQRRAQRGQHRVLVMGDFAGRGRLGAGPRSTAATPTTIVIDVDSFDETLARCEPKVLLGPDVTGGAEVELSFHNLDDFHPDQLYQSVDAFRLLRESRGRLLDPAAFQSEAASLLQPLLGGPVERTQQAPAPEGLVGGLIARLVQPHIVQGADPSLPTYLSALDATASELMRRILHDPGFQALEALWRGMRRLVETLELGDELAISILDLAKEELSDQSADVGDRAHRIAAVQRLLSERSVDRTDQPAWSLLAGCYGFAADPNDLVLLADLGALAAKTGVPFLASATPSLMGCERLDERSEPRDWQIVDPAIADRWSALRRSPIARWIGLALPRILLRLPYGPATEAIESFQFEEIAGAGEHESFLWGNPGLACVEAISRCILSDEDGTDPTMSALELDDLPTCVSVVDGEKHLKPGAEHVLSLIVGDAMLRRGFIPLLSFRDRNAVRIVRIQSIADPETPLPRFG